MSLVFSIWNLLLGGASIFIYQTEIIKFKVIIHRKEADDEPQEKGIFFIRSIEGVYIMPGLKIKGIMEMLL